MKNLILLPILIGLVLFTDAFARQRMDQIVAQEPSKKSAEQTHSSDPTGVFVEKLSQIQTAVDRQNAEIEGLRLKVEQQARQIEELRQQLLAGLDPRPSQQEGAAARSTRANSASSGAPADGGTEDELKQLTKKVEKQLGTISFSGDVRLRFETVAGQLNNSPNASQPAILGNLLDTRNRFRLRARFAVRGTIANDFEWGLRFSTGNSASSTFANQTFTDFYSHKPFLLDQAFVAYSPASLKGLRLSGGKFEPPWARTEMTIDNDLMVEGFSQVYSKKYKKGSIEELRIAAWQLPMLERNSAFIRNADGTVNRDESVRQGRDLGLYGAQMLGKFRVTPKMQLQLSAANLHFYGTQFITPIQFFGASLQLPVTITVPGTAGNPPQTYQSVVSIPRDALISGGTLGLSSATNNALNADGRLSSGFNLVDVLARADYRNSERFPVTLILNLVRNTRVRDLITPQGNIKNREDTGFWGEIQIGKTERQGDLLFGYTFVRLEKDAVLTPFNLDDFFQSSDFSIHRARFDYVVYPKVTFAFTGYFGSRPNGLRGPLQPAPFGSLSRVQTNLHFDMIFKF